MKTAPKVTIELDYPVTIDGTEVRALQMRRMKVIDQMNVDSGGKNDVEKEIALIANLCEISPDDVKELDMMDYSKLQSQLINFSAPEPEKKQDGSAQK